MLIEIELIPHKVRSNQFRRLLKLQCDECNKKFERGWQREVAERKQHFCCGKCSGAALSKNPTWKAKISESTKKRMAEPEIRNRFMLAIERRDSDPDYRSKLIEGIRAGNARNPGKGKLISQRVHALMQDPIFKKKFIESQNTESVILFRREAAIQRWSDPNNRKIASEKMKQFWADPNSNFGNQTWVAKQSVAQRNVWNDDYRLSRSGANNPMSGFVNSWWQPWMSNKPKLGQWAKTIKSLCGKQCMMCGSKEELEAHHIVPISVNPELKFDLMNGIALCADCHRCTKENSAHFLLRNCADDYAQLMKALLENRENLVRGRQ